MSCQRANLFRAFALLTRSGVPLLASLDSLCNQWAGSEFEAPLRQMRACLLAGFSLRQSAERTGAPFEKLHFDLLGVAECCGNLEEILELLAVYEEQRMHRQSEARSQVIQPVVTLGLMLLILGFGLPWLCRDLPGVQAPWAAWGLLLALAILGRLLAVQGWKLLARFPPIGRLRRSMVLRDFFALWGLMLEKGVSLTRCLELFAQASPCSGFQQTCRDLLEGLKNGEDLARQIAAHPYFERQERGCLAAGIESGKLSAMLGALSRLHELNSEQSWSAYRGLFTPLCTLVLGGLFLLLLQPLLGPLLAMQVSL